ncbi:MAG: aldo/keto reductase [Thermodesulfobacteriota bacterium]
MMKRMLGNSGMEVAPLAFGGNVFGWTADEPTSFRLLDAFTAAGGNLVDTADVYSNWVPGNSGGESETILGRWLGKNGNREKVLVATKVGKPMGPGRSGLSKSYILTAAEDSLRRLRTDRIDLYQSHEDDPATPPEETLEAFSQLIRQGKVRAIGASNYTPERLSESLETGARLGLPAYCSLQPRYNLYDRAEFERELLPLCLANGLGVIPYFSLASGFLAGKYRSEKDLAGRARGGFVKSYLTERGFRILDALDRVASEHRSSPAAVALAWLIARPGITAPIASATTLGQLHDLTGAMRLELNPDSIQLLDNASA